MGDVTPTFERLRPRLKSIACRILGSESEVELVLQDASLRWHEVALAEQGRAEAWLIATVARLCLDRFGGLTEAASDSIESESVPGARLIGEFQPVTPEHMQERADDLSVSFLTLVAQLPPEERTAFLLREMFRVEYDVFAQIVGSATPNVRRWCGTPEPGCVPDGRARHPIPSSALHHRVAHAA